MLKFLFNIVPNKKLRRRLRFKFIEKDEILKSHQKSAKYFDENYIFPFLNGNINEKFIKPKQDLGTEKIIWQYWGQGINESTPEMVKACLNSVDKYKEDYKQIILTNDSIKEYIDLPEYVYEKLEKGQFTYTFFSDLLRVCLLSAYGGVWIDATILLTNSINKEYLLQDFFVFQRAECPEVINKWIDFNMTYFIWDERCKVNFLSSFWVAKKNNLFINALRDILLEFWEKENKLKEYFTLHFMFDTLAKQEKYKKFVENPVSELPPHLMQTMLKEKYTPELWNKIISQTNIHKLTYKIKLKKHCYRNSIAEYIITK